MSEFRQSKEGNGSSGCLMLNSENSALSYRYIYLLSKLSKINEPVISAIGYTYRCYKEKVREVVQVIVKRGSFMALKWTQGLQQCI